MRKRRHRIEFHLSDAEYEKFARTVSRSGLTYSSYLRHLTGGHIPRELPPPDYYAMMRELYKIGVNLNQIAHMANATGVIDAERYADDARMLKEAIETITKAVVSPQKMT